jgi:hypothetical protein
MRPTVVVKSSTAGLDLTGLNAFAALADELEQRAAQRKLETPQDVAAQALTYAAKRLRDTLATASDTDVWWTTDRVAEVCGCQRSTVQYWCRNAERFGIRVMKSPSRTYKIHRDDVLAQAKNRTARRAIENNGAQRRSA